MARTHPCITNAACIRSSAHPRLRPKFAAITAALSLAAAAGCSPETERSAKDDGAATADGSTNCPAAPATSAPPATTAPPARPISPEEPPPSLKITAAEALLALATLADEGPYGRPATPPYYTDREVEAAATARLMVYPDNRSPVHNADFTKVIGHTNAILEALSWFSTRPAYDNNGRQIGWQVWDGEYLEGHVDASDDEIVCLVQQRFPFDEKFDHQVKRCLVEDCSSKQLQYLAQRGQLDDLLKPIRP